jgi:hypothetical protein
VKIESPVPTECAWTEVESGTALKAALLRHANAVLEIHEAVWHPL